MLVFEERGHRSTWRKPLGAQQRTNKFNPRAYDAGSGKRTWATFVGGECSHHCDILHPSRHFREEEI